MCTAKPCVHEAACFALDPEAIKAVYDRCDRSYLAAQHDVRGAKELGLDRIVVWRAARS
jgi:hypothetical protein